MAKKAKQRTDTGSVLGDRMVDLFLRGLIRAALILPYRWRVPLMGKFVARVVAPISGFDDRIRGNLAHVMPDLPEVEIRRLIRDVPDNVGRTVMELYSSREFLTRFTPDALRGPGVEALNKARAEGRPVIIVAAHFGSHLAVRAALTAAGHQVGALYNPMKNAFFNKHYEAAMHSVGNPNFARGRKGYAQMLKHLRDGGIVGILIDQYMAHGAPLTFFGKTAPTALSAAEMALKYDAVMIPIYAVRLPDGLNFDLRAEAPIPHSTPEAMTQALNDSLEAITRDHMEQWFWIHRRWKPERQAAQARKKTKAR